MVILYISYCLFSSTGLSPTDKVHQTPTAILKRPEDKVQLTCSHTDSSYNMILWYQQSAQNTALKLIGYVRFTSPTVEDSFKGRFNVSGDAAANKMVTLTINQLTPNSSAVYYCAASLHSASDLPLCSTKTSSLVYCRLITPVLTSHCI
uniref:Ig-like domain-containing protein n=1 Tax=Salmo trutta TaxID=8032 RepID=A0A674B7P2_SALTR